MVDETRAPRRVPLSTMPAGRWRVDNGRGDYAAGTLALGPPGPRDGLLVLSAEGAVCPTVVVTHCAIALEDAGRRWRLGHAGETVAGLRDAALRPPDHFETVGVHPRWTWTFGELMVRMSIWMPRGEPTTYLRVEVMRSSATVRLTLSPWIAASAYPVQACARVQGGYRVAQSPVHGCRVVADMAVFRPNERAAESVFTAADATDEVAPVRAWLPGSFDAELAAGEAVALVCSMRRVTEPAALAWHRACAERESAAPPDACQSTIAE